MARRQRLAHLGLDARGQGLVEREPFAQHHEQRHPALAAQVFEVDDQAVQHLGQGLDGAVQLGCAHAHAVAVDRGVAAAVDDRAGGADLGPGDQADPVAMAPDAGVHVEVAVLQAAAVGIAPQVQRHRRHRLDADQFAHLVHQRLAVLAPGLDRGTQAAALHLAGDHR